MPLNAFLIITRNLQSPLPHQHCHSPFTVRVKGRVLRRIKTHSWIHGAAGGHRKVKVAIKQPFSKVKYSKEKPFITK